MTGPHNKQFRPIGNILGVPLYALGTEEEARLAREILVEMVEDRYAPLHQHVGADPAKPGTDESVTAILRRAFPEAFESNQHPDATQSLAEAFAMLSTSERPRNQSDFGRVAEEQGLFDDAPGHKTKKDRYDLIDLGMHPYPWTTHSRRFEVGCTRWRSYQDGKVFVLGEDGMWVPAFFSEEELEEKGHEIFPPEWEALR